MSRTKHLLFECLVVASMAALSVTLVKGQEGRGLIIGQGDRSRGRLSLTPVSPRFGSSTQQSYTRIKRSSGGDFSIPYLLPGIYVVTVEASGFKKALRQRCDR